jgi:hypothetical protein
MVATPVSALLQEIAQRVQKDGLGAMRHFRLYRALKSYDVNGIVERVADSMEKYSDAVAEYFGASDCPVCYESHAVTPLKCSHTLCTTCYAKLDQCPLCRTPYRNPPDDSSDADDSSDESEVYSRGIRESDWWDFLDEDSKSLVGDITHPTQGTDCEYCTRTINITFDYDVFENRGGIIECDLDFLHHDASYRIFPVSEERRRILKDRFCYMAPLLLEKCRQVERAGQEVELDTLRGIRGY